ELINLASASNKERSTTFGDRLIAAIGKYDSHITPQNLKILSLETNDVEELALRVAKVLDSQAKAPDIEATNLALLAHSARNNQTSLSEALDFAQKNLDPLEFTRLKDMFVKNAGGLYNLMNHPRLESLHLSPYLSKAIEQSARALKNTRGKNFANLYEQIETLLKTTDDQGLNAMIKSLSPAVYDDLLSSLLGSSLARFAQLENPASSFYEFLKYAPKGLEELVAPNMAKMMQGIEGKPLNKANIFDFVHLAIASGETSQFTSKVLDLLPALEKKALAAKNALKDNVEIQALEQAQARSAAEKSALASTDTNLSQAEIKQLEKQEIVNVSYAKWMQAFNLKNTNEPFIPKFAPEVKEALEGVLHGEQIKLTQGSLYKLVKRDKSGLIDYIRPALENSDLIIQDQKALIFVKNIDKSYYFTSVAKNAEGQWTISTNSYKTLNTLKNRATSGEVLYLSEKAPDILAETFKAKTFPSQLKKEATKPAFKSQEFKAKATELYNIAKAQEIEFKGFLENLKSANNSLELGQILKSEASIESKIARKQGDISKISDYLRGAVISKDRTHLDTELVRLEDSLKSRGIKPTIELQHRNASGYKGVHVQFEFNGVPSEIQLHTAKNWRIKKRLDPLYHKSRELKIKNTLTPEELENILEKSRRIAQDSDLDIKDLTSFEVSLDKYSYSEKSVLVRKSATDLNLTQEPLEKSNSNVAPVVDLDVRSNAYNRPELPLKQNESLSGGKGNKSVIEKPLSSSTEATKPPLKSQDLEPKWKASNPKYKPKLSQQARQTLLENEKKKFYKEWAKYGGKPEDQFVAVQFKPEISRLIETPIQISQRTLYANPDIIKRLQKPHIILKQADNSYIIGHGFDHFLLKPKEGHTIKYMPENEVEDATKKGAQVLFKDSKEFVVQKVEPKTQMVNVHNGKLVITNSNNPTKILTTEERLNSPLDLKLPFVGEDNRINESFGKNLNYTYKLDNKSKLQRQITHKYSNSRGHNALIDLIGSRLPRQAAKAYYHKDIGFIDLTAGIKNSGLYKIEHEATKNPIIKAAYKTIDQGEGNDIKKTIYKHKFLAQLIDQALEKGTLKKVNNITAVFETPYTYNNKVYKLQAQVKYIQQSDNIDTGRWVLRDFRCVE
uniref:PBECR2 nuclease fold domain-containing protein n=1 Tax=Helicobacter suis TaxID=104628 RepID=UPI0031F775DD